MYYPKSQIIENLYTNGGEYMVDQTKQPYKGYYYQLSNNQRYTGKNTEDQPNNLLVPIQTKVDYGDDIEQSPLSYWSPSYKFLQKQQGRSLKQPAQPPKQVVPQPTEDDYTNGFFNRYFLYDYINKTTVETNKSIYNQFETKSPQTQFEKYTTIQIVWGLTGKMEDIYKSNSKNVKITEQNKRVYGFSKYFKDKYSQYFRYPKNENLYSNGKELRYKTTKKSYIGYYHIHPEKGPMVGRQHTTEPHDYLEFVTTGSTLNPIPPSPQSGSYNESNKMLGGY